MGILRYCAACNLPFPPRFTRKSSKCERCESPTVFVDSDALLHALGDKLDAGQRGEALKAATR